MAELKKCPFCGSEIKGGVRLTGYMMMSRQYIKCDACGAKMETEYGIDGLSQTHLKAITEDLIKRWNTRPTTTEAEIRAKAKRELAEQIEKRIKEEVTLLVSEREDAREYDDEQVIFAVNNQLRAFDYSLRVVAEQLKGET